jgi:hypothetical protein
MPQRLLVIPGNHDTTWLPDGSADMMTNFKKTIGDNKVCVTPFGNETEAYEDDKINLTRFLGDDKVPPYAFIEYEEYNLDILLLVSSYYSGLVPQDVRDLITSDSPLSNKLIDLLRVDEGALTREYILEISKGLQETNKKETNRTRIAITHHNLVQLGIAACVNRYAPLLTQTLYKKHFGLVMHGHVHFAEEPSLQHPLQEGHSYSIPCPTLTSDPEAGGWRGFNIHLLGTPGTERQITTLLWRLSMNSSFEPVNLFPRYQFKLNRGSIEVTHVSGTQP